MFFIPAIEGQTQLITLKIPRTVFATPSRSAITRNRSAVTHSQKLRRIVNFSHRNSDFNTVLFFVQIIIDKNFVDSPTISHTLEYV